VGIFSINWGSLLSAALLDSSFRRNDKESAFDDKIMSAYGEPGRSLNHRGQIKRKEYASCAEIQ